MITESILSLLADFFKIVIPASLAVYGMYLTIRSYSTREIEKSLLDLRTKADNQTLTLRLQAYERWVLFLERIAPQNLFVRENAPEANVALWQQHLNQVLNQEFMHNVSAQIYISDQSYEHIKGAMQNVLSLINQAAETLDGDQPSIQLASRAFENLINSGSGDPTAPALAHLRSEVRKMMEG
jgi:hypothetical protein